MESFAADLATLVRTPLHENHVAALRRVGTEKHVSAGEMIVRPGAPVSEFHYVVAGELEAVDPATGQRYGGATLGPTQYTGDLSFMTGGNALLGNRATQDSDLIVVPRAAMLKLMSEIPEMSDIIVTVFAARRRRMIEGQEAGIILAGAQNSRALREIAAFAGRNRLPWRELNLNSDEARALAHRCNTAPDEPFALLGETQLVEPQTPKRLAELLGMDLSVSDAEVLDVLIVGAGPAGVAAGVYAGAEGLSALVLEDTAIGGQAGTSSRRYRLDSREVSAAPRSPSASARRRRKPISRQNPSLDKTIPRQNHP